MNLTINFRTKYQISNTDAIKFLPIQFLCERHFINVLYEENLLCVVATIFYIFLSDKRLSVIVMLE